MHHSAVSIGFAWDYIMMDGWLMDGIYPERVVFVVIDLRYICFVDSYYTA